MDFKRALMHPLNRPLVMTILGWLFIAVGATGLVYGLLPQIKDAFAGRPVEFRWDEEGIASFSRIMAIVGGVGILYGRNWARWLLLAWMIFHVVVAAMHSASAVVVHCVLFTIAIFFLFRPQGSAFFRAPREES